MDTNTSFVLMDKYGDKIDSLELCVKILTCLCVTLNLCVSD